MLCGWSLVTRHPELTGGPRLTDWSPALCCASEASDGRISSVSVYGYQKRYEPEKCYVFILRVQRENMTDPVYVFRTYKEFIEFGQRLAMAFPLVMDFYRCAAQTLTEWDRMLEMRDMIRCCSDAAMITKVCH